MFLRIHDPEDSTERFEAEREHLGPLPRSDFDTSARYFRNVGKDCLAHFDRNRYMVLHRAVCKKLLVRVKDGLWYRGP